MKKLTLTAIGILFFLGACRYEDGPKLSFRTKKARAVNIWYIDKAYEDGTDKTDDLKNAMVNYRLEIKKDDTYELSYRPYNFGTYNESGSWKFSDDKGSILFTPSGASQDNVFKILRLKNQEIWVSQENNGKTLEYHLKD